MPDGSHRTLRLKKVAYCPGFSSSLVSLQTLIDDDQIFWDTLSEPMRLVRKGQTIGITERKYQQFVVEYQPVETEFPDFNNWTDLARDHENYVRVMFITDAFSGMVFPYFMKTYKAKEHGAVLKDFSSFMLARFGFKTNVVRSDGELFTKKISAWMRKKGMTKAMSASNTQDQNGGAERKKNQLSHLRAYGCRAYAMTANAQLGLRKRWKLDPRAHIGYLIGYKSTNIFLIWVPLLKKVIATRDVVFDEYTFFEGGGERMPLPASIGEMIQQIEIPEGQTANQAILDEETDEDTDIEDFEDDDIRMAEDNEDEEQGQQQSEEQEKKTTGERGSWKMHT
ncbi:Integrase, catalytic core [Hirsutella rhossiliensis]|uniref:Integrase, catalytic core n=1 Tax=Hirsutella rhossiliensis TaxID=111463 RepID=A0A9P8N8H1_9HYPO|nr:Integrase, catalytic core [Hirsutella rhossiliensis]KAH0968897.1 Integrase, catalytic core [Hirsutella rhossiliensis]